MNNPPQVCAVVASAYLGQSLDCVTLGNYLRIDPSTCESLVFQRPSPVYVLKNGKIVYAHAKSEKDAKETINQVMQHLQHIALPRGSNDKVDYKTGNILAVCDLGFEVLLELLALEHHDEVTYEPELFEGLVYKLKSERINVFVFPSGKAVFSGATHTDDIENAFQIMKPILTNYALTDN